MQCYIISSKVEDVYYNLALEAAMAESLPKHSAILFLWRNANTVVIGKHQNPYRECNLAAMKRDNIRLARRSSGGGAVFHDEQNLNFSFIYNKNENSLERNYHIIVSALERLGINAEKSGRNDILACGKKFSGNAFYTKCNAYVHHGTIMVGVDMSAIAGYLTVSKLKLESKGVASTISRVINLQKIAPTLSVQGVEEAIASAFLAQHNQTKSGELATNYDRVEVLKQEIEQPFYIMGEKYNFDKQASFRFPIGEVTVTINADNGIEVYSDFLDTEIISYARERLRGEGDKVMPNRFDSEQLMVIKKIEELAREVQNEI